MVIVVYNSNYSIDCSLQRRRRGWWIRINFGHRFYICGISYVYLFWHKKYYLHRYVCITYCTYCYHLWWQLHQPLLAVIMIALIDSVACYPTWRKTLKDPSSETLWTWVAFTLGNALSILVLNQYNALTLIYLITITFTDFSVVLVILYGRYLVKSHLQKHI